MKKVVKCVVQQVVRTKRRSVKLKCLVCTRVFDDDYRADHNNKYHPEYRKQNKIVPYKDLEHRRTHMKQQKKATFTRKL